MGHHIIKGSKQHSRPLVICAALDSQSTLTNGWEKIRGLKPLRDVMVQVKATETSISQDYSVEFPTKGLI